jgi:hypothetical protein
MECQVEKNEQCTIRCTTFASLPVRISYSLVCVPVDKNTDRNYVSSWCFSKHRIIFTRQRAPAPHIGLMRLVLSRYEWNIQN